MSERWRSVCCMSTRRHGLSFQYYELKGDCTARDIQCQRVCPDSKISMETHRQDGETAKEKKWVEKKKNLKWAQLCDLCVHSQLHRDKCTFSHVKLHSKERHLYSDDVRSDRKAYKVNQCDTEKVKGKCKKTNVQLFTKVNNLSWVTSKTN